MTRDSGILIGALGGSSQSISVFLSTPCFPIFPSFRRLCEYTDPGNKKFSQGISAATSTAPPIVPVGADVYLCLPLCVPFQQLSI